MASSGFNVKVKINSVNKILKDHGLSEDGRVIKHLTTTADRLMMPFVPRWFWWYVSQIKNIS